MNLPCPDRSGDSPPCIVPVFTGTLGGGMLKFPSKVENSRKIRTCLRAWVALILQYYHSYGSRIPMEEEGAGAGDWRDKYIFIAFY